MEAKYFLNPLDSEVWHTVTDDWVEDEEEKKDYRCTFCGEAYNMNEVSEVREIPEQVSWCKPEDTQNYPGTKVHGCHFFGMGQEGAPWFWVGRPPVGEPVAVANLENLIIAPTDNFYTLLNYVKKIIESSIGPTESKEDKHELLVNVLHMSEEEATAYLDEQRFPGGLGYPKFTQQVAPVEESDEPEG